MDAPTNDFKLFVINFSVLNKNIIMSASDIVSCQWFYWTMLDNLVAYAKENRELS